MTTAALKPGAQVVRVSLAASEGKLDERGTVRQVFKNDAGEAAGYSVEWEGNPPRLAYVAPIRITDLFTWQQQKAKESANVRDWKEHAYK